MDHFNYLSLPTHSFGRELTNNTNTPIEPPMEEAEPIDWLAIIKRRLDREQDLVDEIDELRKARLKAITLVENNKIKLIEAQTELDNSKPAGQAVARAKVKTYRINVSTYEERIPAIDEALIELNIGDTLIRNALDTLRMFNVNNDLTTRIGRMSL